MDFYDKNVIGLGYFVVHDSNVALLSNGEIKFASSEERFSRIKKDGCVPIASLDYAKRLTDNSSIIVCPYYDLEDHIQAFHKTGVKLPDTARYQKHTTLLKELGVSAFLGHHFSHAAGGYYTSGFNDTIVITYDGGIICEPWLSTIWHGKDGQLHPICKLTRKDGAVAAIRYSGVTTLLGFKPVHDEGKITGLAAYGKVQEDCISILLNAFESTDEPKSYWNGQFAKEFAWIRNQFRDTDIAATIQYMTEQSVLSLIKHYVPDTLSKNCVLAGGLFANVKLNQRIKELGFQNLYVYPAMGDDGLGLGAALGYSHKSIELKDVYLGSQYKISEIENTLIGFGLDYKASSAIEEDIAQILAEGLIVARFSGAMEFGPRSLGNRSILASTIDININLKLNHLLGRTEFMPFAPVTIDEYAELMYLELKGFEKCTPFMTVALHCTETMKKCSPAVVHIDGTARPQIISRTTNESYYHILKSYHQLTGVPSLINTSFNLHGEPIVCSPSDAIRTFIQGRIDYLAIEHFLVPHPQLP